MNKVQKTIMELKPCKYCGEYPTLIKTGIFPPFYQCLNMDCLTKTREKADINKWNDDNI